MDRKELKKKVTPGMTATKHRLETSSAVQNALRSIGTVEHLAFLRGPAGAALSILKLIQDKEGDVNIDLVELALDGCGLVYIVIDKCEGLDTITSQTQVNAGALTQNLDNIRVFCIKKINGSLYRKIKKQGEDEKRIAQFRSELHTWMENFGGRKDISIHDYLEEIIAEKLRGHEREKVTRPPKPIDAGNRIEAYSESPPLQPVAAQSPSPIIIRPQIQPSHITQTVTPKPSNQDLKGAEAEDRRRQRIDELKRKEERERWRKSEQLYNSLPPASPSDDKNSAESALIDATNKMATASIQRPLSRPTVPAVVTGAGPRLRSSSPPSAHSTAAGIEAATRAKQVEDDHIAALILAGRIEKEIEREKAEEAKFMKDSKPPTPRSSHHKKSSQPNHSKNASVYGYSESGYDSDDSVPVRVEAPRQDFDEQTSRVRPSNTGSRPNSPYRAPRSHSPLAEGGPRPYSPHHNSYPNPNEIYDPESHPPFDMHRPLPVPQHWQQQQTMAAPQPTSPPQAYPGSMQFSDITNSAISLGGGPVYVHNYNSGNTSTVTYKNSMNDYSRRTQTRDRESDSD